MLRSAASRRSGLDGAAFPAGAPAPSAGQHAKGEAIPLPSPFSTIVEVAVDNSDPSGGRGAAASATDSVDDDIRQAAQRYFDMNNYVQVVLYPEK